MAPLEPFRGSLRKLVVAMDVGTTYSGVAYAFLDPGEVPQIQGVTRFPGQENIAGNTKIPSILYYRRDGTVHSVGAEAAQPGIELEAEDEDLVFVEWFKLHLRPETLDAGAINRGDLPSLPDGKRALDVLADFMRYLFDCTHNYVCETHANGESMWSSVAGRIEFVLSHPNGWEGPQQGKMRQAAIMAQLVPDTPEGHGRVHFVTEGEASLHFCIRSGLTTDMHLDGENVMIVDAGGGTIDISTYTFVTTNPLSVEEIASPDCILQGATRLKIRAAQFLKERLKDSPYGNDEDIKTMVDYFDKSTKTVFKDANEPSYIKFGSMKCNDPKHNIRRGQLTIAGTIMESLFKPSLDAIVIAIASQQQTALRPISTVFLVGGFAASPWLYTNLQRALLPLGFRVCRPDTHMSKAVAEGGVSFYLEHFVSARVFKLTYGISINTEYDPTDPEHILRSFSKEVQPSGRTTIPSGFSSLILKGTRVRGSEEISRSYYKESREPKALNSMLIEIMCYRGTSSDPRWTDIDPECFTTLCTVFADTSKVKKQPRTGHNGSVFYVQDFDVVLMCGLTELQAQIRWTVKGKEKRGPAKIIYDDNPELSA